MHRAQTPVEVATRAHSQTRTKLRSILRLAIILIACLGLATNALAFAPDKFTSSANAMSVVKEVVDASTSELVAVLGARLRAAAFAVARAPVILPGRAK